jgi:PAS domain S-box-containing protein
MLNNLAEYFGSNGFMPHGHCFLWTSPLLWTYVVSDFVVAASYFSIAFALWYFVRKRRDLPFSWMFVMFGAFVLACGSTHAFAIWNIWHTDYWADAGLKVITAMAAAATAVLLWPMIPRALTIPTHAQLENANRDLLSEVAPRKRAEIALHVANEALEQHVAERTSALETANSALRESEARFRALTSISSDFYWESDAEHRFTQGSTAANRNVAEIWRTLIGRRRWETPYLSPDEAGWQAHRAALDAHLPFRDFQLSRPSPDGTELYLSISGDPLFDASGAFVGYRGVGADITNRKLAENALRAAEEQFRGLVEQSIAGIYIVQDGKFVYVNPRAAEIIGQGSVDEVIGTDPLPWISGADRGTVMENMRRLLDGEVQSAAMDFGALRRDGIVIQLGVHAARATHEGRPAIIGLLQDISEKKRAEEEIHRYVEELKTAFMSTVEVATIISEMRDPYTSGHERRVAEIAAAIGAELGFDAHRQEGLRVAGHLHDIGKMTIPSEILSKPGKLGAIEYQLVQGHTQASYDVLKNVKFPWPVAQVALQHHERMDGTGYPQGLKGDAILLEARIMAVADVVEAMSSHRPYRPGLGIVKALAEIERGRGTAYDADVAVACLRLFREKHFQVPP